MLVIVLCSHVRFGPSFTKLFRRTKFVNAIKRYSAANLVRQSHVAHRRRNIGGGELGARFRIFGGRAREAQFPSRHMTSY